MINDENFSFYLRYLVKIADTRPLFYNEIPKVYYDFFSIPAISQALNIIIDQPPPANYSAIENYIDNTTFDSFDSLCNGIKETFTTDIDKLYAAYYYTTHNIEYDMAQYLSNNIFDPTIKSVFKNKRGICGDYTRFFIRIAKRSGVNTDQNKYEFFVNVSKASAYKPFFPPKTKKEVESNLHACALIQFGNLKFMSEPTWGAGRTKEGVFTYDYRRSLFLIPYYTGLLNHFPYEDYLLHRTQPFSFDQFVKLNRVSLVREVSLESNPFQVINSKNGFYEVQFSFVQFSEEISSSFLFLKGSEWVDEKPFFVSFTCLDEKVPAHNFTYYPEKLRVRYKMTVILPKKGDWKVIVKSDKTLFDFYLVVDDFDRSHHSIPLNKSEGKNGFIPVTPTKFVSTANNGCAKIRFAIDNKRSSSLIIETWKIDKSFIGTENKIKIENILHSFETDIFDNCSLIEKWLTINFPSNGLWEICMYLLSEEENFMFYTTYLFDVKNYGNEKFSPVFDLPKNRIFTPFNCDFFSILPSFSSVVVKKSVEFHFHVLSKNEIIDKISSVSMKKEENLIPKIVSEKATDIKNVKDREYSVTFPNCGHYELKLNGYDNGVFQQYFVVDFELRDESDEEKKLIDNLKCQIESENDYIKDIPAPIREQVDQMLADAIRSREINGNQSACCLLI